jgi:NADH-quinone oxidoreductase subunit N
MRFELAAILPELVLGGAILLLIVLDIALRGRRTRPQILLGAAALALAAAAATLAGAPQAPFASFAGMLAVDGFAFFIKGLVYLAALLGAVFGLMSPEVKREQYGEYLILLFCVTLGMSLLAAAQNLLLIYISLELVSLPSYILAGFRRGDRKSSEAALKYVLFGAASSGLMLYGFSLLYGMAGTLQISGMLRALAAQALQGGAGAQLALAAAVLLSLAGFAYKVAAVPFHMWCPDVYEGAPTPITAFLSIGPKAAGIAALMRFLIVGFVPAGEPVGGAFPWPIVLGLLSIATMTVGNLAAIPQDNVKRLLAYSSIAHAGYMLMAVAVGSPLAMRSVLLYLAIYLLMNAGAFLAVMAVREKTGSESISAYRGLGTRSPLLAVVLAIFLFSLVGIPPFAGFIGKFFLFAAVLQTKTPFFYALAAIGVVNSVISLYYYARIIRATFLEKADGDAGPLPIARPAAALLVLLAVPTLVLGVWWGPLMGLVERSAVMLR